MHNILIQSFWYRQSSKSVTLPILQCSNNMLKTAVGTMLLVVSLHSSMQGSCPRDLAEEGQDSQAGPNILD